MKIVQSFWSKPFLRSKGITTGSRLNGGWVDKKYNYYSMALSCLQLRKYYDQVELVTDDLGKFLLIDQLNLPFTTFREELNCIDGYDECFWALGKLYTYGIQTEPFLHVDGDIFIMKKFPAAVEGAALVAQNIEVGQPDYVSLLRHVKERFDAVPAFLLDADLEASVHYSNAGILGGSDLQFFKTYTEQAFAFVNSNDKAIAGCKETIDITMINFLFEQNLFLKLAQQEGVAIEYLFPHQEVIPKHIGYFHAADANKNYIHALGDQKRSHLVYSMLETKLQLMYPDCFNRINNLINTCQI